MWLGWDNITTYERAGIEALQRYVETHKDYPGVTPSSFTERDWLKWIQSGSYDEAKTGERLVKHLNWLIEIPRNPRLTDNALRLLQSGAFYLHGRDKWYRPAFIMDGGLMAEFAKNSPELVTPEVF